MRASCAQQPERRRLTARASRTSDGILSLGFLAVAFERGLLAAGTFGLGSADTSFAGAATAGGWDSHGDLGKIVGGCIVGVVVFGCFEVVLEGIFEALIVL